MRQSNGKSMKSLFGCSLLALSRGFTSTRPLSARLLDPQTRMSSGVHRSPQLYEETEDIASELAVPTASDPVITEEGEILVRNLDVPTVSAPSQEKEEDLGKEIFMDNLEDNMELVGSSQFDVVESSPVAAPDSKTPSTLNVGDTDVTASVSALLAASEDAVVNVEASLPSEIADKLEFHGESDIDIAAGSNAVKVSLPVEALSREILPASSVVGEPATKEKISAPPVGKILRFAVPAIGVWLCGPLLSLIDTSSVGLLSGTTQQAALNPAVAVTDYAALLIAFLYTATTNLIAAARETDRGVPGKPRTAKTFVGAMQLSTYVGAGLGAILFVFARTLLRTIIGNDGISPAVFDAAMKYVRIRALGMPAAAVIGSAQAACLGMQDIRSPLYVLGVAAGVNFLGDMLFVGSSHPLIGGAAGAAWATVFSQYAAVAMFVHWLCRARPQKQPAAVNVSDAILELTGKPKSAGRSRRKRFRESLRAFRNPEGEKESGEVVIKKGSRQTSTVPKVVKPESEDDDNFSVRGFLANRFRGRDLVKLPDKAVVNEVSEYVLPVTSTQVGRVSGYVAMSHVVSSSLGTISMAAQQVIVSLFYCLCPINDSLSLTAQSFLPAISEKKASKEKAQALRQTGYNFAKAGGIFGAVSVALVSCIPLLSRFFTTDLYVASLVNMVAPYLIGFFSVHGIVCAMEGVLLGRKDLSFLGKMYAAFFGIVPYFMLRVKRAALAGTQGVNLTSIWRVFVGYQIFRVFAWSARAALLQRRANREAVALGMQP